MADALLGLLGVLRHVWLRLHYTLVLADCILISAQCEKHKDAFNIQCVSIRDDE